MKRAIILATLALAACGELAPGALEQADRFGVACVASGRDYDTCKTLCWDEYAEHELFADDRPLTSCQRAARRELLQLTD